MFEKVNPSHPDKLADRIAGAMVDIAYEIQENPQIAVEALLGHENCFIVYESSVQLDEDEIRNAVRRITGVDYWYFDIDYNPQDTHLAENQSGGLRCGDNGIFKGCPVTKEQDALSTFMRRMYETIPYDGKAVLDGNRAIVCQSHAVTEDVLQFLGGFEDYLVNPLGPWTGGPDVDTGATNRKLGSDMGDAMTGGGLHGKDLSKADVSVNIACHLLAQSTGSVVTASCAIGDEAIEYHFGDSVDTLITSFETVVNDARKFVSDLGGFEKFAEWGLV